MKFDREDLLLYAVTDSRWLNGERLYEQVEKALKGGATFIQLREKELDQEHFFEEAVEIKELCARYHVPFVINDNVEIALKMDADGVHVGQDDMEAGDVRAKLGPNKIIGVSAHTVEEALLAEERGADYLGVGAVFPTGSKTDVDVLDGGMIREITEAVHIPGHCHWRDWQRQCRKTCRKWAGRCGCDQCHFAPERYYWRLRGN